MTEIKKDSIKVENGRLLIDVALEAGHPSASGKTTVYYSTGGNITVGEHKLGLTLYKSGK
jgi:hypothetical protein